MSYTIGELIRCKGFFSQDGTPVTPTTVTAKIKSPAGTISTYTYPATVSLDLQGNYYVDVSATSAGRWWYRFESGGTGQAAKEAAFDVKAGEFP